VHSDQTTFLNVSVFINDDATINPFRPFRVGLLKNLKELSQFTQTSLPIYLDLYANSSSVLVGVVKMLCDVVAAADGKVKLWFTVSCMESCCLFHSVSS